MARRSSGGAPSLESVMSPSVCWTKLLPGETADGISLSGPPLAGGSPLWCGARAGTWSTWSSTVAGLGRDARLRAGRTRLNM
eukprot:3979280-Prymnesium_polylepis.1